MRKVVFAVFSIISVLLLLFTIYHDMRERMIKDYALDYVAATYEGNQELDRKGSIYDYYDGYYAVGVQSKQGCNYYLQVKVDLLLSLEELVDAHEYNGSASNSECLKGDGQ